MEFHLLQNIFYINLDTRVDRKMFMESQFATLGLTLQRFSAIRHPSGGAIGCSLSHVALLEYAIEHNLEYIVVLEDDFLMTNPARFIQQFNAFIRDNYEFDVLLLAGNNVGATQDYKGVAVKVVDCQTTTGYIVKNHYFATLLANYKEGVEQLILHPSKPFMYAIDQWWKQLQRSGRWYLITPLTNTQRPDYSDIEKRKINYNSLMLQLHKNFTKKIKM